LIRLIKTNVRTLLLICLFCFSFTVFPAERKAAVVYDTSKVFSLKKIDQQKEKEIFSDKDFVYDKEAKVSKGWMEAFLDWLARLFGKPVSKNPELSYNILKYSFIGLFIAGVIFILWKSKFSALLKGNAKKLGGASFTDLPENIEGINIDKFIEEAMRSGNYRLAVRWCFLKSLQWLNKQHKITWQPAKTNIDYQQELTDKKLKEDFTALSKVFEYTWYGEISLTEKTCIDYRNSITKFIDSMHV
jgi:hypothetical protein